MSDFVEVKPATFKTWLLLTYDLQTGSRSCLAVCNCPFRPNNRSPMYSTSRYHKQAWVEFNKMGDREVQIGFQGTRVTVLETLDSGEGK